MHLVSIITILPLIQSYTPAFLLQLLHEFRIRISSFFRLQCGNLDLDAGAGDS
jgi:hypothetical protein